MIRPFTRTDYRTSYKNMNISELKTQLKYWEKQWDKWFVTPFGDDQEKKCNKHISFLKAKIKKLA